MIMMSSSITNCCNPSDITWCEGRGKLPQAIEVLSAHLMKDCFLGRAGNIVTMKAVGGREDCKEGIIFPVLSSDLFPDDASRDRYSIEVMMGVESMALPSFRVLLDNLIHDETIYGVRGLSNVME